LHRKYVRKELLIEVLLVLFFGSEYFDILKVLKRFGFVFWIEKLNIVIPSQSFLLTAAFHSLRKERRQ